MKSLIFLTLLTFFGFYYTSCASGISNCTGSNVGRYKCSGFGTVSECIRTPNGNYAFVDLEPSNCSTEFCKCGWDETEERGFSVICSEDGSSYRCVNTCSCRTKEKSTK